MSQACARTTLSLCLLLLALADLAVAADYTPGGKGSLAENWGAPDGDRVLNMKPIVMFIYYGAKNNKEAQALEGADCLGNSDLAKQIKTMQCVKFDISRNDKMPKKWPEGIVMKAKSLKNAVGILSSDLSQAYYFKKGGTDGSLPPTAKGIQTAIDAITKYEAKRKELLDKQPKTAAAKKEEEPKEEKKQLLVGLDDPDAKNNKKDAKGKKEEKKSEPPKKPVVVDE